MNKLNEWIKDLKRTASQNTVDAYPRRVEIFFEWLGNKDLNKKNVKEFLDTIEGKFSTVNGYKMAISSYCKFLELEINPTHGIKLKRDSKSPEIKIMTKDQYNQFMECAEDEKTEELKLRYQVIFTLGRESGMRIGEILKLKREDIGDRFLLIKDTKNGTSRKIPVSLETHNLLQLYLAEIDRDELFTIVYDTVNKRMQAYCKRLGIPYGRKQGELTFHCARHGKATELIVNRGIVKDKVASYLGNSVQTLEKYTHVKYEDMMDLV